MSDTGREVIFIATTIDPDLGGIARSVPALAKASGIAAESDHEMRLYVPEGVSDLNSFLKCRIGNCNCIYHAGVWSPINHAVAKAARRHGIPLIVSTRSMLDPWALNHRKWKKKLAWWLYAKRDLLGATLIHATAEMEAEFIRDALGGKCPPIIVVPNGVELPDEDYDGRDEADKGGLKRILFLSRIHPKKGVLDLIKAFGDLKPEGWELVIAGNDDGGHRAVCEDFASHQVNADRITFTGPVSDADKWEVYRSADLFVLPSYSENFGIVIGEALGMGVPVITTTATPWERMEEKGCGWWIAPGEDSLTPALKKALELDPETRAAMGKRGSAWIRAEFTWESVGRQFVDAVRGHGLLQDTSKNAANPR